MSIHTLTSFRRESPDAPRLKLPDGTIVSLAIVPYETVVDIMTNRTERADVNHERLKTVLYASNHPKIAKRALANIRIDEINRILDLAIDGEAKRMRPEGGQKNLKSTSGT